MKALLLYSVLTWFAVLSASFISSSLLYHAAIDAIILTAAGTLVSLHAKRRISYLFSEIDRRRHAHASQPAKHATPE